MWRRLPLIGASLRPLSCDFGQNVVARLEHTIAGNPSGMDFNFVVEQDEVGVCTIFEGSLAGGNSKTFSWMQRGSFEGELDRTVRLSSEDSDALIHGCDWTAEGVRAGNVRFVISDLDVVLTDAVHSILESHRRDCIGDQNQSLRVSAVSDSQRGSVGMDAIGNDAEVHDGSVGNLVRCQQPDKPGIPVMELGTERNQVSNKKSGMARDSLAASH